MKPLNLAPLAMALLAFLVNITAQAADLQGQYQLDSAASDNIETAIERTVAQMSFIKRPFARSRLTKSTLPLPNLTLARDEREIVVTFDVRSPVRMPSSGNAITWTRNDGETFQVQGLWTGTELRQTFKAADGERSNVFRLDPRGDKLTMQVTLNSPQLPAPLQYTLVYRRL